MKCRILFLFFICTVLSKVTFSQIAYYSAKAIADSFVIRTDTGVFFKNDEVSQGKISGYLQDFLSESQKKQNLKAGIVFGKFEDNPFIGKFVHPLVKAKMSTSNVASIFTSFAGSALGGFDVTTIADGVAKFLVQRTKEELSVTFFVQLKEDFNDSRYGDLRILFPQTASILNLIDTKIYQFSAYLTQLRDAFILDLDNLPLSASVVINQPKYKDYFAKHTALKDAFQCGLFISNILINKDSLRNVASLMDSKYLKIDSLFALKNGNRFDTAVNASLKTMQLVSASLRTQGDQSQPVDFKHYWIPVDSLWKFFQDDVAFEIYLGLIYQQAFNDNIIFPNGQHLTDLIKNSSAAIANVQNSIYTLYSQFAAFDNYRIQYNTILKSPKKDSVQLSLHYYGLYTNSLNILETGFGLVNTWIPNTKPVPMIDSIIKVMKDVGEIYMYVVQKKYSPAVLALVKLYGDAIPREGKTGNQLLVKLTTYSTFFSQVANAKTSDAVDTIITQTVLPVGSSYIKKHSVFNLALQAYTGLFYGKQQIATDTKFVGAAGICAPIGLAASWGFTKKGKMPKYPGSFSLFASIVDLGSLVTFRFSNENDTIANNVNVRLAQIVSPGLHAVFGLPKVPISIGAGCNWAPLLTDVEKNQIKTSTNNAFRYQIFVAVDIPLLNFYNKPR